MCQFCKTKPVYEFTNQRKLCKTCFIQWFQKKVLYTIRKFKMIKLGEVVGYENKGDFRGVVLEDVLKIFSQRTNVKLARLPTTKKVNKIALPFSTDSESEKIIKYLIKGKEKINLPKQGKHIFPLYLFLDKEILLYANLRGLKFKEMKKSVDKISKFIDEMEKKHPELKQAIVKSYLKFNSSQVD